MKVLDGDFPEYLLACDCDHAAIKRLIFSVRWDAVKSVWVTTQAIDVVLDTIGVFFDSFQEGIAEAIACYEREIEIKEKRDLFEVIQ